MANATPVLMLLTRPAAQSLRFTDQIAARFGDRIKAIISPLMKATFLYPTLPEIACTAVIFTSETGVAAAKRLQDAGHELPHKAICVGSHTATAATLSGFSARSAGADAANLLALILAAAPLDGPLLYLHGRDTSADIADALNSAGLETFSAMVYEQIAQSLTDPALAALASGQPIIVPLFSPRSATLLVAALKTPCPSPLLVVAMSQAVAIAAAPLRPFTIQIAATPDSESMLNATEVLLTRSGVP